jgi:hypothetical protein
LPTAAYLLWNQSLECEQQEERAEQQFVGHRVKVVAQDGALLQQAREGAVQRIGQPGSQEQPEAERKPVLQNRADQKRRQANAQQREQIGSGPKSVRSFFCGVGHG